MAEGDGIFISKDLPISDWKSFVQYVKKQHTPLRIGYKIDISVQNLIFESALHEEKISYTSDLEDRDVDITLVNLHGAKNLIPSIKNGLIDGFVVNQPFLALAEHQKLGRFIAPLKELPPYGKWEGIPCCALAGNSYFIKQHRDITRSMVSLLLQANKFIQEQPQRAATQAAQWLNLPVSVEEHSLKTILFSVDFDRTWQNGLDFWITTLVQKGKLKDRVKTAQAKNALDETLYDTELYFQAREVIE
jgi:NitT/TauT family transport system substrate-binding protein